VTDLLKALLGNGLVNMFQHATMGAAFSVTCNSSLLGSTTIHTTVEVFSVCSSTRNSERISYVICATQHYKSCVFYMVCAASIEWEAVSSTGEIR
jgi:hypothetical protein